MAKAVMAIIENCVACKSCEIACAVEHSESKSLFGAIAEGNGTRSRMRVENAITHSYPSNCNHCQEAACMAACPTGAMQRKAKTDSVFVDEGRCIGCWMCVMVCPFGAVTANSQSQKALKCDRCPDRVEAGQNPACVDACPTRALVFASPEEFAAQRRLPIAAQAATGAEVAGTTGHIEIWRALKGAQ
jgi:carbon-monoxide dehydrogenase iron sulfur subunit